MKSAFQRYLLPGLVFQSICIGGGYGTGREIVEFFLQYGPVGGLLGLLLPATIIISVASIITFELARIARAYDYRTLLKLLLGRAWFLYEIAYLISIALVLAVVGAAVGTLVSENFNIPDLIGTAALLIAIAALAFKGTKIIEGVMSGWSFVLYTVYISILVSSIALFGPVIQEQFAAAELIDGWLLSASRYSSLQIALLPAVLFAATHIKTRRDAVIAGALTGPLFLLPAIMFFVAMTAHYPAIIEQPVPINYVLGQLNSTYLFIVFPIVLVGTFIETGTGMIHAFNQRIESALQSIGRSLPNHMRAAVAVLLLIGALLMSRFGLIDLVAVGYGAMTWVFIVVLLLPLLTVGVWRIVRS